MIKFNLKRHTSIELREFIQFIQKTQLPVWFWDVKGQAFIFISNQLINQFEQGMGRDMKQKEVADLLEENTPYDFMQLARNLDKSSEFSYPFFISLPNGEIQWLNTTIIGIENKRNRLELLVGIVRAGNDVDNQEIKSASADDDHLAILPNLSYGWRYIEKLIARNTEDNSPFVLYKIAISNFDKLLNTHGHLVANKIIFEVSVRLNQFLENRGFLFHSYTDGWYAVVESNREINELAYEMIEVVKAPLMIDDQKLYVNANVGISIFPADGNNVDDLMKHTTNATTAAAEMGPGETSYFIKGKNIKLLKESQLVIDFCQSIERGELYVEYQPKIAIKTLKVVGAEALVRWKHPVWGKVSPGEFIPIAKDMGLEYEVTQFVLEETIHQMKEWEDEGIVRPCASVNLSPDLLYRPDIYEMIKDKLKKYEVSPSQLEIEITEEAMLKYDEPIQKNIKDLQDLGVRFALDDMGEGFTSLYDLTHFKFDTLKIDRRAIDHIVESNEQKVILRALLDICKNLKITSIVEGVESKEQFDILREMGCIEIQGFYFSPSVSGEEMTRWFKMDYAVPGNSVRAGRIERRKYFRVKLPQSLDAEMRILSIKGRGVVLERNTKILVQDIGPGGLKFYSYLQLPVNDEIIYQYSMRIIDSDYCLTGKIVWGQEFKKGIFEYGIEFSINETEREKLTASLFKLSSLLRENPSYSDGNFISDDPVLYLRILRKKVGV